MFRPYSTQTPFTLWKDALCCAWDKLPLDPQYGRSFGEGFSYWVDMQNYLNNLSKLELAVYDIDIDELNQLSQEDK